MLCIKNIGLLVASNAHNLSYHLQNLINYRCFDIYEKRSFDLDHPQLSGSIPLEVMKGQRKENEKK